MFRNQVVPEITNAVSRSLISHTEKLVTGVFEQTQREIQKVDDKVEDLREELNELKKTLARMVKAQERVEEQVALDARTTHTTTDVLYDSQPNPTILCLNTTKKCTKKAVERT
eukprot:3713052-Karenia_brevis.AAC.1